LNPDKICNFDCVYCQVDRRSDAELRFVDVEGLIEELAFTTELAVSGRLYEDEKFRTVPEHLRRVNDIAFAGDGEPTTLKNFGEVVDRVLALKASLNLPAVKLVLITNASMFHRENVQQALARLMTGPGEIWAKLDAGTADYYRLIERTPIPFERILSNLTETARQFPLVIQSLFLRYEGSAPSDSEITAYIRRLRAILAAGGRLDRIQVYTIARTPAESIVSALSDEEVDAIASRVRRDVPVPVESYYGG
jgi:wyosine [tRNA(Phe)-imidazoG37] synthetase (radical SAM superfamily)